MRVAAVVPCYRHERWLPRTVRALEGALREHEMEGVLVRDEPGEPLPPLGPAWRVIEPPRRLTPGAARMLGLSASGAPWVLFCDADVEVDAVWVAAALARAGRPDAPAGIGGRLEEWFEQGGAGRPGQRDMYRVGDAEREVPYLATLALYRREPMLRAGGYDPRLTSEEDYELGLRLRRLGERMVSLGLLAGRHYSPPRPSWSELGRRWRTGLCFGQGQVLRLYLGRPGLGELVGRQRLYVGTLGGWLLGLAALAALPVSTVPLAAWTGLVALAFLALAWRKRSAKLALFSLLTWSTNAAGMVRGFLVGPVRCSVPPAPGVGT